MSLGKRTGPVKILFSRFPGNNSEMPCSVDWFLRATIAAKKDSRISEVFHTRVSDTPITMSRNLVLERAKKYGADYVLMLDSDNHPDYYLGQDPTAKPFFETAFDFAYNHDGPCVVAAPYCGPPPHENVFIFRWANFQSDHPDPDFRLDQYTREEAAFRGGFEEVAALPTGVILIDMRALDKIQKPYFYYEWKDESCSEKASTEDVTFTRDLSIAGVPQYVLWDSWAAHLKTKVVGKPQVLTFENIRKQFKQAERIKYQGTERLIFMGEGRGPSIAEISATDAFQDPETTRQMLAAQEGIKQALERYDASEGPADAKQMKEENIDWVMEGQKFATQPD